MKRMIAMHSLWLHFLLTAAICFLPVCVGASSARHWRGPAATRDPYYNFMPVYEGSLLPGGGALTWSSPCFDNISVSFEAFSSAGAKVSLDARGRRKILCDDVYVLATQEDLRFLEKVLDGRHSVDLKDWSTVEYEDVLQNGIHFFRVNASMLGELLEVWDTLRLFWGPTKDRTIADNIKFIQEKMNITMKPRTAGPVYADIPASAFRSGDQLAIFHPVQGDILIMWGTGSRTTHHAVFIWIDGELYVAESCYSSCLGPVQGIQKTPWSTWSKLADAAGLSIAWLPLAPELSAAFNETAAIAFLDSVYGLPYGFHNFIFGWIDTANSNFPLPLTLPLAEVLAPIFDKVSRNFSKSFITEGLSIRLGLSLNSTIDQINAYTLAHNMSYADVVPMPEQDNWVYSDGRSIVCDVLWLLTNRAAGALPAVALNASSISLTEFHPGDAYTAQLFDANFEFPSACAANNDGFAYCQLMGPYVLELPAYNTESMYAHMNERCPTVGPAYPRQPGC
jgi:hypothetical protein